MGKIIELNINTLIELGFQLFNTLVLFAILKWILYKPVYNFLEKRKNTISNQIDEAAKLKEEALKLKEEYEKKLEDVNKEADEILVTAHKKAIDSENEIVKRAKDEADKIKNRAKSDMEMAKEQAKEDIKKEIIDVSAIMTKKIINISLDEDKHKELIEESIKEIGDVKWLA